jgi:deoxyribodipyrimidine photo-lyase
MINIFWHRRDIRIDDNAGLYHALRSDNPVQPIFIFDTEILDKLSAKDDARVTFIYDRIEALKKEYKDQGCELWVYYGKPIDVWKEIIENHELGAVYTNRDYESYAIDRDNQVESILSKNDIAFNTYKDHVIFEKDEVLKKDGTPYTVFTPYKRTWLEKINSKIEDGLSYYYKPYPVSKYFKNLHKTKVQKSVSLKDMGFERSSIDFPSDTTTQKTIKEYGEKRNFPAIDGTSQLGVHFRFGTISIRKKAYKASKLSDVYLSELVWRDFYSQILANFPHVENNAFRSKYEAVEWRNNEEEFQAWCDGMTGYPIVDAGMRELNTTGYMHNRVRMITASFLTKHLLIDWRWGEAYFAEKLLDFDLSSNNGGWQWAAGCGTDAAPYFRIFNPYTQQEKFDKKKAYINKWIPEFGTDEYPDAIVDHKEARERCLKTYKEALN